MAKKIRDDIRAGMETKKHKKLIENLKAEKQYKEDDTHGRRKVIEG